MTERRYAELLQAAPAIRRDEMTRVLMYQPRLSNLYVAVVLAFR